MKLIDEEIMNSQMGKQDARKIKDLIGKMDDMLENKDPHSTHAAKLSA